MTSRSCSSNVPQISSFEGYVATTTDGLQLVNAAIQGIIPRIIRRLNDSERRQGIKSGAIFIFSVKESGVKRWTDGRLWSPSRIDGNFLIYREIRGRDNRRGSLKKTYVGGEATNPDGGSKQTSSAQTGSDQGTAEPDRLIKKTLTVTMIDGQLLHLISYYSPTARRHGVLKRPSYYPNIMNLYLPLHIFQLTAFTRAPLRTEIGPDGKQYLAHEPEKGASVAVEVEAASSYGSSHSLISSTHPPADHALNPQYPSTSESPRSPDLRSSDRELYPSRAGTHKTWPLSTASSHAHPGITQSDSGGLNRNELWIDSSCMRPSNPYHNAVALRKHANLSGSPRYTGGSTRELGSQRLSWMMNTDASNRDSHGHSSHSRTFYAASSSAFDDDYSYASGWSGSDLGSSIAQVSHSQTHQSYPPSYTSGSD